jgi:hypothetical protein
LKAPITVRDLHSEVRRDWIQLIGRKLAHITAVKTGLGECPRKRGSPENKNLDSKLQTIYTLTVAPNHNSMTIYCVCRNFQHKPVTIFLIKRKQKLLSLIS